MHLSATSASDLKSIVDRIDAEYYELVVHHNGNMLAALKNDTAIAGDYSELCSELAAVVQSCIEYRRTVLIPYLAQLRDKEKDGHNCSTCSGGCKVQHNMHIISINGSHTQLKDMISRISVLRSAGKNEIPALDTIYEPTLSIILLHLFDIEVKYLVPGIIKAQKAINAY